jgi:hypothetical protein
MIRRELDHPQIQIGGFIPTHFFLRSSNRIVDDVGCFVAQIWLLPPTEKVCNYKKSKQLELGPTNFHRERSTAEGKQIRQGSTEAKITKRIRGRRSFSWIGSKRDIGKGNAGKAYSASKFDHPGVSRGRTSSSSVIVGPLWQWTGSQERQEVPVD